MARRCHDQRTRCPYPMVIPLDWVIKSPSNTLLTSYRRIHALKLRHDPLRGARLQTKRCRAPRPVKMGMGSMIYTTGKGCGHPVARAAPAPMEGSKIVPMACRNIVTRIASKAIENSLGAVCEWISAKVAPQPGLAAASTAGDFTVSRRHCHVVENWTRLHWNSQLESSRDAVARAADFGQRRAKEAAINVRASVMRRT